MDSHNWTLRSLTGASSDGRQAGYRTTLVSLLRAHPVVNLFLGMPACSPCVGFLFIFFDRIGMNPLRNGCRVSCARTWLNQNVRAHVFVPLGP